MEIENLGIYKLSYDIKNKTHSSSKIDVDISDRDIWLESIEFVSKKEIGSSNYSYDILETYRLYFQVNSGKGAGTQYNASEDWTLVLQVTIPTWYRIDKDISKKLLDGLKDYSIINRNEVYNAFLYRRFYIPSNIKI